VIFVTSWDDGHPFDERIADLLERYSLMGTFFVPIRNREGLPVLSAGAIRALDGQFEVGSHTQDHIYLTELSPGERWRQVIAGKMQLEDILGHAVEGFCYPGGKINSDIRQSVIDAGFSYARGINNFWLGIGSDRFDVPTTFQFFPHCRQVLWRNFARGGSYRSRFHSFRIMTSSDDWLAAMIRLIELEAETDNVIHLWGHSWEMERKCLWPQLDEFLRQVAAFCPQTSTVAELMARAPISGRV